MDIKNYVPFNETNALVQLPTAETPITWSKSYCRADGIRYGVTVPMPNAPAVTVPRGNEVAYAMIVYQTNQGALTAVREIVLFGESLFAIDMKPDLFLQPLSAYTDAITVIGDEPVDMVMLQIAHNTTFNSQFVQNSIFRITDPVQLAGVINTTSTVRSGVNGFGKFPVVGGFQMFPHWLMYCNITDKSQLAFKLKFVDSLLIPLDEDLTATNTRIVDWIVALPHPSTDAYPEFDINLIPFIKHEFPSWGYECVPHYLKWYTTDYVNMPVAGISCINGTTNMVDCSNQVNSFTWSRNVGNPPPHSNPYGPYHPVKYNEQIAMFDDMNNLQCLDTLSWVQSASTDDVKTYFWPMGQPFVVSDRTYDMQDLIDWDVVLEMPENIDNDVFTFGRAITHTLGIIDLPSTEPTAHRVMLNAPGTGNYLVEDRPGYTDYKDSEQLSALIYGNVGFTPIQLWAINPESHYEYMELAQPVLIYACVGAIEYNDEYALLVSLGEVLAIIFTKKSNIASNVDAVMVNGRLQLSIRNWPMHSNHYDYLSNQLQTASAARPYFYTAYAIMNHAGKQHVDGTDWPEWLRYLIDYTKVEWCDIYNWNPNNFTNSDILAITSKLADMRAQAPAPMDKLEQLFPHKQNVIHEPFLACTTGVKYLNQSQKYQWKETPYYIPVGYVTCDVVDKFSKTRNSTQYQCNMKAIDVNIPLDTTQTIYKKPKTKLLDETITAPTTFPSLATGQCIDTLKNISELNSTFINANAALNASYAPFLPKFVVDGNSITDENDYNLLNPPPNTRVFNDRGEIKQYK